MKFADYPVPPAREEGELQDTTDGLTEIGRYYGKGMNVGNTEMKRMARQPPTIENVGE